MSENDSQQSYDRCGAKTRKGTPCGLPAGHGTDHVGIGSCRRHGGNMRNHIKHAQKIKAQIGAEAFGLSREIDPHDALLEELHRTAGIVIWYQAQIAEIEAIEYPRDDSGTLTAMHESVGGGGGGDTQEEMHVYVRALHDERKHLTAVAKTCIGVGIEERRVRLAEREGQIMADFTDKLLIALGIEKTPEVRQIVRKQFTLIAGGAA